MVLGCDLVEECALQELGFQFKATDSGGYALDCRITVSDIDALVDRSFMIRETNFRRQHRQLTWSSNSRGTDEGYGSSQSSESHTTSYTTDERSNREFGTGSGLFEAADHEIQEASQSPQLGQVNMDDLPSPDVCTTVSSVKPRFAQGINGNNPALRPRSLRAASFKQHVD